MPLTSSEYLAHLSADGHALCAAAAVDLTAPVRSCPGWDVAQLVRHTGHVHRHKTAIVRRGGIHRPPPLDTPHAPEEGEPLLEWYREGLDDLLSVLAHDPDTPVWSWDGDHRLAFWQRRMAQETLVHRWDAEAAVSALTRVDPDLAVDGVDELLRLFAPMTEEPYDGPGGAISIVSDDAHGMWTVRLRNGLLEVSDEMSLDAEATIQGHAGDLLLALWRRLPLTAVQVAGDTALVHGFLGWIDED